MNRLRRVIGRRGKIIPFQDLNGNNKGKRMTGIRRIETLNDLFIYASELERGSAFEPIELGENAFTIALHIDGDSWDKRIDKRSAHYVINLQNALDDMMTEFAPGIDNEKLLVKVDNKEGSLESLADVTPFLTAVVNNMTDTQTFIAAITAIAALAGVFMWNRYQSRMEKVDTEAERTKQIESQEETRIVEKKEETAQEQARQETLKAAFDCLTRKADADPDRFSQYERPIKGIVKTMDEEDTIEVCALPGKMEATFAKKCGPKRAPRSEEQTTYADGSYTVNSRRYDEGQVTLELEQGRTQIKGYLWQLDEADREKFIESLDRHEKEEELPFSMDLQINVVHTNKNLKYAVILGEAAPREGKNCVLLDSILAK